MNDTHRRLPADDIEALLRWYAAGTLDPHEADRVAAAVAVDPGLARRLDLCREEMIGVVAVNEQLGVPSPRVAERLIAAMGRERRRETAAAGLMSWLAALTPRTYAFAGAAAAAVVLLEAGVIAKLALQNGPPPGGATYQPASMPAAPPAPSASVPAAAPAPESGAYARVKFGPEANVAQLSRFLDGRRAEIVGGPRDGFYRVRISPDIVTREDLDRLTREFQSASPMIVSAEAD